jgi:hypothetical protein
LKWEGIQGRYLNFSIATAIKMGWDFTSEDVLKGNAHYSVAQFRDDLLKEIRETVGDTEMGSSSRSSALS